MKVLFSHGKESGPWGSKIAALAKVAESQGFAVDSIDYQDLMDPDERVDRLLSVLDQESSPVILVGSSMGGYVSLVASKHSRVKAAFLMAPALYIANYKQQTYPQLADRITIVHGWSDDVVPPEVSIRYGKESHANVHLIPGDHRLNAVLPQVVTLFIQFLDQNAVAT